MQVLRRTTGPLMVNTYLLYNEAQREMAVVDPAGDAQAIQEFAKQQGKTITHILLTHGHFDHILAVNELRALTGARVYVGAEDALMLRDPSHNQSLRFLSQSYSVEADVLLGDEEVFAVGAVEISVLSTPGHTPGSICYYFDDVLISGDTLFQQGYGRTDLPGGDMRQMEASLRRLSRLPANTLVYPGHGERTTIGEEFHG